MMTLVWTCGTVEHVFVDDRTSYMYISSNNLLEFGTPGDVYQAPDHWTAHGVESTTFDPEQNLSQKGFVCTFNEGVVVRQTFLHEAAVRWDELLKKHHVRGVSMWRQIEEGDRTSVSKVKTEP